MDGDPTNLRGRGSGRELESHTLYCSNHSATKDHGLDVDNSNRDALICVTACSKDINRDIDRFPTPDMIYGEPTAVRVRNMEFVLDNRAGNFPVQGI